MQGATVPQARSDAARNPCCTASQRLRRAALGNVMQRSQYWPTAGFTENFDYDNLNRLKTSQVLGQPLQSFTYDAIGNLKSKSGNGDYSYPAQGPDSIRPHAVQNIANLGSFAYDANGNLENGAGRSTTWTSFDMPKSIVKVANGVTVSSDFAYGPEHQRSRQSKSDGTTVWYAGAQEAEIKAGQLTLKTYWPHGLGVEIDKPGASVSELNWTHTDRLGSVIAISDANGNLKEKLAYDAWGKRRSLDGGSSADSIDGQTDNKGYTGHEMLDQLDLVHMNGRVYDPQVARFISADPFIQDPEHSQSYNRYTYVWNNPTNLTDPTGFVALTETSQSSENCDVSCQNLRRNTDRCKEMGGNCGTVGATGYENVKGQGADSTAVPKPAAVGVAAAKSVMDNLGSGNALQQGRCSTPSNACAEQNARYEAAYKARAEGDAINPFSGAEEVGAVILATNAGVRLIRAAAGAIFAGRAAEVVLSESRALTTYYPANEGFLGATSQMTLKEGQMINRFGGSEYSRFFSPPEVSALARSLPPGVAEQQLRTFQVLKSFEIQSGTVAPAFNQFGLGTQYRSSMQLGDLLKNGFLKEVK